MDLKGKTAIVTGASKGLGKSISYKLAQEGTTVFGLARSESELNKIKDELGESFVPVVLDVSNRSEIQTWFDGFKNEQTLDILINNAGFGHFANVEDTPTEVFDSMLDVNVKAIYDFCRLSVPLMKANEQVCHIIQIASVAGLMGNPGLTAYNATKYAVRGFSNALMKEVRNDGIKVSCVFPGSIETPFFDRLGFEGSPHKMHPDEVADTILFLLKTSDNYLIDEITLRPRSPK